MYKENKSLLNVLQNNFHGKAMESDKKCNDFIQQCFFFCATLKTVFASQQQYCLIKSLQTVYFSSLMKRKKYIGL